MCDAALQRRIMRARTFLGVFAALCHLLSTPEPPGMLLCYFCQNECQTPLRA